MTRTPIATARTMDGSKKKRTRRDGALFDINLDEMFKRLHLANARRCWRDLVQRAEKDDWSHQELLSVLVAEEVAHRSQTRISRLSRKACFPFLKTIDDFNFTYQSTLRQSMIGSYLSSDFVTDGRSLILFGKTGRGKTHLAVAIAYRAIQNGFDAYFVTAAALIDDLSRASMENRLSDALSSYVHTDVLIVDEVGYLGYGPDAANVLFHVVNERHRKSKAMIFTTNKKPKAEWGRVLHDPDLAEAIVDRVLERGRLIKLDGPSVRTLHIKLDEDDEGRSDDQADRISGIPQADFPEPTTRLAFFEGMKRGARHACAFCDELRSQSAAQACHADVLAQTFQDPLHGWLLDCCCPCQSSINLITKSYLVQYYVQSSSRFSK